MNEPRMRTVVINDLTTGESGYIPTVETYEVDENTTLKELLDKFFPAGEGNDLWNPWASKFKTLTIQRPHNEYPKPPF